MTDHTTAALAEDIMSKTLEAFRLADTKARQYKSVMERQRAWVAHLKASEIERPPMPGWAFDLTQSFLDRSVLTERSDVGRIALFVATATLNDLEEHSALPDLEEFLGRLFGDIANVEPRSQHEAWGLATLREAFDQQHSILAEAYEQAGAKA